jgi:hypothetical protein
MPPAPAAPSFEPGDPRRIMRWARRYAKSRTISFLVQWVVIVVIVSVVGIAAGLTNEAYRAGNMGLVTISVVAMAMSILALTWFSASAWGSEVVWRVTQWLYGREGYVAYESDAHPGPLPWWLTALGGGLVVYHLLGALLVTFNKLPLGLMQPYSALYMAPFLGLMIYYQRLGIWAWIWPVLYAAHAVAVLQGWHVVFRGQWQMLNMVGPIFGYGLVAILVGHAYSRFALWQLKRLTRSGMPAWSPEDEDRDEADPPGSGA